MKNEVVIGQNGNSSLGYFSWLKNRKDGVKKLVVVTAGGIQSWKSHGEQGCGAHCRLGKVWEGAEVTSGIEEFGQANEL